MAQKFLNGIAVTGTGSFTDQVTIPETPTADAHAASKKYVDDQVPTGVDVAKRIEISVKNISGGQLIKGTVVHAAPSASPPSGNLVEVVAADYDAEANMPAIGILNETLADDTEGVAVMMGAVSGIDTDDFTAGDELYVGADGALTNSKPQTAGQLIQKIAVCVKSHASNGLIKVFGAGRSNDVPLPLYIDNTNQRLGIRTSTPSSVLDVHGSLGQLFSVTDNLSGDLFSVSDISGMPIFNVNSSGAVDIDGTLNLGDSDKIQLGASQDLQIYHDGSASYISEVGTGDLIISADNDLTFKDGSGNIMANMNASNSVELMYGNVKKFETTSTGVSVIGNISATDGTFGGNLAVNGSNLTINGAYPRFNMYSTDSGEDDYSIINNNGIFGIYNVTQSTYFLSLAETTGNATFAGAGTFETTLNVSATDSGSSPAVTSIINMHGYDGRGVGIKMKDNVTTSGGGDDNEWFVGTGYNQSGFNIGYAADGSQSSYSAQAKLQIATNGNATFAGDVTLNTGTAKKLSILASTHDTNTAQTATLELGYTHSGGAAAGNIVLTEAATNAFDADMTFGLPHNNGSGGSTTRTALTLDGGTLSATFTGSVTASNLSGTNTGDQVLPTDFVSKANGGTFSGNVFVNAQAGVNTTSVNAANKLEVHGQARVNGTMMIGDSSLSNTTNTGQLHIKNTGEAVIRLEDSDNSNLGFDIKVNEGEGFAIVESIGGETGGDNDRLTIAESTGLVNIGGDLTVGGNLTISGTTTTLNTQTVEVEDNILQLNTTQGTPDTATAATSGISIYRGDGVTQASLIFDDGDDTWDLTNNLTVAGDVIGASFAVPSGASTGFLKADGSVDGTTYSGYNFGGTDLTFQGADPGDIVWKDANGTEVHRIWSGTNDYLTYRNDAGTTYELISAGSTSYNNTNWDTAYTHSQATHAPTDAEANVQSDWNATSGDALILNKPTILVPEFFEEKFAYQSNDLNAVYTPMVKGGLYGTNTSSVTGAIRIDLPSYQSAGMINFYVDIYEYSTGDTVTFRISGYAYNDSGATWHNCSVVNFSDDNNDYNVRFISDTANSKQCVTIGEVDTNWTYPQVLVRDAFSGYNTSESEWKNSWNITFVTSLVGTVRHTFTDNLPYADWDRLEGKPTSFAPADAEANVQADWNATSGDALILNKPTIPTDFVSAASGGTFGNALQINHSAFTGLSLTRDDSNGSSIDFSNNNGLLGRVGYLSDGTLAITNSTIGTSNMMSLTSGGDAVFSGSVKINDEAYLDFAKNTDVDTGAETVAEVSMADYTAAFFDFVIKKGTNVRSGTVYACHDGGSTPVIEFTEISTQDLGDTSDVVLSVDKTGSGGGSKMRLLATTTSDDWSVKTLIRAI